MHLPSDNLVPVPVRADLGLHLELEAGEVARGVVDELLDLLGRERRVGLLVRVHHGGEGGCGEADPRLEGVVASKSVRHGIRVLDVGEPAVADLEVIVGVTPSAETTDGVRVGEEGTFLDILVVYGYGR